jgi:DNA polymerase III delta prime subunit
MNHNYLNQKLERTEIETEIKYILSDFEENQYNPNIKRGIYIYGTPGCGKTLFVQELLKSMDYDVIFYNAGEVRNKSLFQSIDSNHTSNRNVLDLMKRKVKRIAIVMDEIDGMNSGDKGGIDALIKLIRQKKTKKQKAENTTSNPIICIGNHENDKKIRELMKACHTFELKTASNAQITDVLHELLPVYYSFIPALQQQMIQYIQGDLRKLNFLCNLWKNSPKLMTVENLQNIFQVKTSNEDAKKITWKLLQDPVSLDKHNVFMNETDRTTVALLWHENVVMYLSKMPPEESFPFYVTLLCHMCFADYIGRITFQSQIWQFNEMTSLIKTFYNNHLFHEKIQTHYDAWKYDGVREDIDFTKVLTKYSTEYNNYLFLQGLCQKMNLEKKDVFSFFQELRLLYGNQFFQNNEILNSLESMFEKDEIESLDIKRIYRFMDKNVKKEDADTGLADCDSSSEPE